MPFYDSDNMSQWFIVAIMERLEFLSEGDEQIDFINTIINPKGGLDDGVKDFCQDAIDMMVDCVSFKKALMNTIDFHEIYVSIHDDMETELDSLMEDKEDAKEA
jgi:hypothetical protein